MIWINPRIILSFFGIRRSHSWLSHYLEIP